MGEVRKIDPASRLVFVDDEMREIPYDYLIVAPGVAPCLLRPRRVGAAMRPDSRRSRTRPRSGGGFCSRSRTPRRATIPSSATSTSTFVVVGGGPTGVELSGALPFIARKALGPDFRAIDTRRTRVILVEAGPRILPSFPETLARRAASDLTRPRRRAAAQSVVTRVERDGVRIGDEKIRARTVFWAAGNKAIPLGGFLDAPLDRAGRVQVKADMSVPAHPEIFAVGDLAVVVQDGRIVPGVCPAANQEGATAAKNILRDLRRQPRKAFRYFNKGDLATIGRSRAIADFGIVRFTGRLAWFLWLFVHIMYLVGFRNRISVLVQWTYAYITYQRGVRLITDVERYKPPPDARGGERNRPVT